MDERIKTLAYEPGELFLQSGEGEKKVLIHYTGEDAASLARQLVKEVYKSEGYSFYHLYRALRTGELLLGCGEKQLNLMAEVDALLMSGWTATSAYGGK